MPARRRDPAGLHPDNSEKTCGLGLYDLLENLLVRPAGQTAAQTDHGGSLVSGYRLAFVVPPVLAEPPAPPTSAASKGRSQAERSDRPDASVIP